MKLLNRPIRSALLLCCLSVFAVLFWTRGIKEAFAASEEGERKMQDLAKQIEDHQKSGDFDKALEISQRALKSDLDEHQQPWPVLLDQNQQLRKAYQIKGLPFFIVIDKTGNWQYNFLGSHLVNGQPLIWMIEALLSD